MSLLSGVISSAILYTLDLFPSFSLLQIGGPPKINFENGTLEGGLKCEVEVLCLGYRRWSKPRIGVVCRTLQRRQRNARTTHHLMSLGIDVSEKSGLVEHRKRACTVPDRFRSEG